MKKSYGKKKSKECIRCFKNNAVNGSHYCQECIRNFMLYSPQDKMIKYYKIEKERLKVQLDQKLKEIRWLRENIQAVEKLLNEMQIQTT